MRTLGALAKPVIGLLAVGFGWACSDETKTEGPGNAPTGGAQSAQGGAQEDGSGRGGSTTSGATGHAGAASGGAQSASAGVNSKDPPLGGTAVGGSAQGGAKTGGTPAQGGLPAAGGSPAATGGVPAIGGATSSGGSATVAPTGGQTSSGGTSAGGTGFVVAMGGVAAGGVSASGGSVTGGVSSAGGANGGISSGGRSFTGKLDVLFVIDNSLSMADKQEVLIRPVPELIERLVNPRCVDASGRPIETPVSPSTSCTEGTREFTPVVDLHVGVVTSSLGARGKPCSPGATATAYDNDRGELVAPLRSAPHDGQGFLAYDGTQNLTTFLANVAADVKAAGEQGCGYESTQEAWYRFLVDPEPPAEIVLVGDVTTAQGIDSTLLAQRSAFLRPDSAVVIVALSDENDCSIIDYGQGWLTATEGRLPRGTSMCTTNPNDRCCFSCRQQPSGVPADCPGPVGATTVDAECQKDAGEGYDAGYLPAAEDAANLRCYETKRRFGFDLLFPLQRYINGLSSATIVNRSGQSVANPLFAGGRDPSLVTMVGIVGVPWQDLATDATLSTPGELELLSAEELTAKNRWSMMVGNPDASPPVAPADPFMVESVDPRSGTNPVTGQAIVAADSTNPQATINGHEVNNSAAAYRDDLQYACIFPLVAPRDCTLAEYTTNDPALKKGCDCKSGTGERNRPLCQPPGGGTAGTSQYYAKAYPGIRHLRILEGLGNRAVVGSICPRNTSAQTSQDYGYGPVVQALMTRLRQVLQ